MVIGPDFRVVAKLGEGSFAEVFKVKSPNSNEFLAIKRLKKRYRTLEEVNRLPEILALKALQGHPNVIKLTDLIYDNTNGYVAMAFELMDCNVYELISEHNKPFDEKTSLILIYQLLKAIAFMHSKNMFHRDIKPENCMVCKETMVLKLCDFGSTRGVSSNAPYTEYVSTRWYRAPECILTSGSYGPEVDEWAVGCMLYELLTSRPLFPGKTEVDQIARIHNVVGTPANDVLAQFRRNPNTQISFKFPQRAAQDLHKLLPKAPNAVIELLSALLVYNPQNRIGASDALKMDAFADIRAAEREWEIRKPPEPFPWYYLHMYSGGDHRTSSSVRVAPITKAPQPKPILQTQPQQKQIMFQMPQVANNSTQPEAAAKPVFVTPKPEVVVAAPQPKPVVVSFDQKDLNQSGGNRQFTLMTQTKFPGNANAQQSASQPPVKPQPVVAPPAPLLQQKPQQQPVLMTHQIHVPAKQPYRHEVPHHAVKAQPRPADVALIESRMKAVQRIKAWQQTVKGQGKAVKRPQPYHGAAFQFAASGKGVYQKPRPEIVQPRLPKIVL